MHIEELVGLYWQIGHRIRTNILADARADYGKEVIGQLAKALSADFGRGFNRANLHRMVQFAATYPDQKIVAALRRQLSWTHFRELLAISDPLKRGFYAEMCRVERWSTRTLKAKVNGMLFERTAIAKKPEAVIRGEIARLSASDALTPNLVFRDPYVLDFLEPRADHSEQDLKAAILQHLEAFILELGSGFAFVARQKRMQIGPGDYYLDLLLPPKAALPDRDRTQARSVRCPRQRSDGAVSALARQIRA